MQRPRQETEELIPSYLKRLTQAPLLCAEEELSLCWAAKEGNEEARRKLVESNMRLVINIARCYRRTSLSFEDLVQEGAIGLMLAIERFDPTRGFRFSTYATHWIRQSMTRALENKAKAIRLPAHVSQSIRRIDRERLKLARELGREPSHEQLACAMGISASRLAELILNSQELLSLDMRIGDHDSSTLGSLLPDTSTNRFEEQIGDSENADELERVFAELSDREQLVMRERLKQEGQEELTSIRDRLSKELRISRERIRQIELTAMKKLRLVAQDRRFSG